MLKAPVTLKIRRKLVFRINDHLEFAIIVCQKHLLYFAIRNQCFGEYKSTSIDVLNVLSTYRCRLLYILKVAHVVSIQLGFVD